MAFILGAASEATGPASQVLAGGLIALIAGAVGAFGTLFTEGQRQRAAAKEQHRDRLRDACADFSSVLVRMTHLAWRLTKAPTDSAIDERLAAMHEEARTGYERIRLLSDSVHVQEAGRFALRHAYAVWQEAKGEGDPRQGQFGLPPRRRFEEQLEKFYVEVRRELGRTKPEDVMPELTT